jgi:hypothetical protein
MPRKTDKLSIRIDPVFKEGLRKVAEAEHRSIANMIEVLIRERCRDAGVTIPEDEPKQKKQVRPNIKPGRA